jgi:hypothetical protein
VVPKQRAALSLSLGLPLAALTASLVLTEKPLLADCNCLYAGQQYSQGACIQSVCAPGYSQLCYVNFNQCMWSSCNGCTPPL